MRQALLVIVLMVGCADEIEPVGQADQAVTVDNGTRLNGTRLNGTRLNGTSLNGTSLNGTRLNGTRLNGTRLNGTSLDGTSLDGTAPDGTVMAGAAVVGSTWTGQATDELGGAAGEVALRIDSAEVGTGPDADVWSYGVSFQTTTGWQPLCGVDDDRPIMAVPVAGTWGLLNRDLAHYVASTTEFTWACRGASIAKCVELGYKPWTGHLDHLASCVRLLRGDFCGKGKPWTADGTLLNLFDNVGVQLDTEAWNPEAAWGPDGALCLNKSNTLRSDIVRSRDPNCLRHQRTKTCGTTFLPGAYLLSELP